MKTVAAIYTVAEDEPPYPVKPGYPDEPEFDDEGQRGLGRVLAKLAFKLEYMRWVRKCGRVDDAYQKVIDDWTYATKVAIHGVLTIPCALKVVETGETILADEHGDLHRGWGACRPSLLKAGQQLIYMGTPFETGAKLKSLHPTMHTAR